MDQPGTDRESLLTELKERLDEGCIVFGKGKNVESLEEIAMTDEAVLDYFMEHETVRNEDICRLIRERKIFPCYFGSALRMEGVEKLIRGLDRYTRCPVYPEAFGAKVYKIARDDQGNRLSYMKITGGTLKVKELIITSKGIVEAGEQVWAETEAQIRIYTGA